MQTAQGVSPAPAAVAAGTTGLTGAVRVRLARQPVNHPADGPAAGLVAAVLREGGHALPDGELADYGLRLRGLLLILCREVEATGGGRLVARVRALVDDIVPATGATEARLRTVRAARAVQALLDVTGGADPDVVLYGVRREPWELRAAGVRETVRLARSWQETGVMPHPATLREVTGRLRADIGALLPQVDLCLAGLLAGSPEWRTRRQQCADAARFASRVVPARPGAVLAYAVGLAGRAEELLRLAETGAGRPVPDVGVVLSGACGMAGGRP